MESENNIIKHVAKEIYRECSNSGLQVSQELAEYMVRIKLLNPKNGYTAERVMPRDLTQKLISSCVQDLASSSPAMDAIKLQIYWNSNTVDRSQQKYNVIVTKNSETFLKEILESKSQERNKILRKIIAFVVAYSGVGSPNLLHVMRETKAVIQSVFKSRDVQHFSESSTKEKIEKLEALTRIVVGIRLYHKYTGLIKDGIDDLPGILSQGLESTKKKIEDSLRNAGQRINLITLGLKALYAEIGNDQNHLDREDLETCKDVVIIMRQYEDYFRKLAETLEETEREIEETGDLCQITLHEIQDKVKNRAAIPTFDIYPLFTELGNLWVQLQIKTHYLIQFDSIITNLNSINKYFEWRPFEASARTAEPEGIITEMETTNEMHPDVVLFKGDPSQVELQFQGFCAWTLSQTQGFLLPGNPKIGLLLYREFAYAFSSPAAARQWSKDPVLHVNRALNAARCKPALVQFLGMYRQLDEAKHLPLIEETKATLEAKDARIQTELHPIKSFLDKDYSFSEWELKRKALQLSRIIRCRTKSQQTVGHSSFRAFIGTQTAPNKVGSCQTRKDNSCVTPAPSRYIWGSRGLTGDQVRDFSLTLQESLDSTKVCR